MGCHLGAAIWGFATEKPPAAEKKEKPRRRVAEWYRLPSLGPGFAPDSRHLRPASAEGFEMGALVVQ